MLGGRGSRGGGGCTFFLFFGRVKRKDIMEGDEGVSF